MKKGCPQTHCKLDALIKFDGHQNVLAAQQLTVSVSPDQVGGITKLRALDGAVVAQFSDNVLDSMALPFPMVYDQHTKVIHFGRAGKNEAFALDAISGAPIWDIPVTEAGWPTSAVLCSAGRVVFLSDDGLLASWDQASSGDQKPLWQVSACSVLAQTIRHSFILYCLDCLFSLAV